MQFYKQCKQQQNKENLEMLIMTYAYLGIAIFFFIFMSINKLWKSNSTLYSKTVICLFWPVSIIVIGISIYNKLKEV
jgi:uncharacterized BrkB/YihY/UPF0761 family membrane protein